MKRPLMILLAILTLLNGAAYAARWPAPVTMLGGGPNHNHAFTSELPAALCLEQELKTGGSTLSEPLAVAFDADPNNPQPWQGKPLLFHLGEQNLYVHALDGSFDRAYKVQERHSWGYITYAQKGAALAPRNDVLYVTTDSADGTATSPNPGVKAFRVWDLLTAPAAQQSVAPLGQIAFPGSNGIVSAPLYMGEVQVGNEFADAIVIAVVPDLVVIVKNLADNRENGLPIVGVRQKLTGWDSGSALRLGTNLFAIGAGPDPLDPVRYPRGIHFFYVEGATFRFEGIESAVPFQIDFARYGNGRPVYLSDQALSQLARDPMDPKVLYAIESSGNPHKVEWPGLEPKTLPEKGSAPLVQGFSNVGAAVFHDNVYYGLRWEPGTTSTNDGKALQGRLFGMNKADWSLLPWSQGPSPTGGRLTETSPGGRSWINVTPAVWADPAEPITTPAAASQAVILTGDAGGAVNAFSTDGAPRNFFLTEGAKAVPCAQVDDPAAAPGSNVSLSSRVLLTDSPYTASGADAWFNTQGVATEMSIYGGRLLTGFDSVSPSQSAMLVFRAATNASIPQPAAGEIGPIKVFYKGNELAESIRLAPGRYVDITVPVRLEADPLSAEREVEVALCWLTAAEPVCQTTSVTLAPFATGEARFPDVVVPKGATHLMAVVNPMLYARRFAADQGRVKPDWVTAEPTALPAGWDAGLTVGELSFGEVTVLDNAALRKLAPPCGDLTVSAIDAPPTPAGRSIPIAVTVHREGCLDATQVTVSLQIDDDPLLYQVADWEGDSATTTFWAAARAAGAYPLVATVDPPPSGITETNEENNDLWETWEVIDLPPDEIPKCPGGVDLSNCFRSVIEH